MTGVRWHSSATLGPTKRHLTCYCGRSRKYVFAYIFPIDCMHNILFYNLFLLCSLARMDQPVCVFLHQLVLAVLKGKIDHLLIIRLQVVECMSLIISRFERYNISPHTTTEPAQVKSKNKVKQYCRFCVHKKDLKSEGRGRLKRCTAPVSLHLVRRHGYFLSVINPKG